MNRRRHVVTLAVIAAALLCELVTLAAYKPTNQKINCYRFNATRTTITGATEYLSGDSGDVIYAYPAQSDTAGKGRRVAYIGGARKLWSFCPDSSEVWNFYETTGYDTLLQGLDSVYIATPVASESLITSARDIKTLVIGSSQLAPGSVTSSKLATGAIGDSTKFGSDVIPLAAFKRTASNRIALPKTLDMRAGGGTDTIQCTYIVPADSATGVSVAYRTRKAWLTVSGLGLSSDGGSGLLTRARTLTSWSIINTDQFVLKMPNRAWYILGGNADSLSYFDPYGSNAFTLKPSAMTIYTPVTIGHARADSIITKGTFAEGQHTAGTTNSHAMQVKNNGGTGSTTIAAPRVTGSPVSNLPIWGQAITTGRAVGSAKGIYVAGMSSAGYCIAQGIHTKTDTGAIASLCRCACVTDSVIVFSSRATADTLNYQYTRP